MILTGLTHLEINSYSKFGAAHILNILSFWKFDSDKYFL